MSEKLTLGDSLPTFTEFMARMPTQIFLWSLSAAAGMLLTGCGKGSQAAMPMGAMAVPVVAVEAKRQAVTESLSLVGSILANELVEIKSETEGTVQEINFKEGQRV